MSPYRITLTSQELHGMLWLAGRGYCGARTLLSNTVIATESDNEAVLAFPNEASAWEWVEDVNQNDGGLWSCANEALANKLQTLWESIV